MKTASSVQPGTDVGYLGDEVAAEPFHQFVQSIITRQFEARLFDEEGVDDLEKGHFTRRSTYFSVEELHLFAIKYMAFLLVEVSH